MAIYKMEIGKTQLMQLTNADSWNDEAKFSPDGNYIIWASSKDIPQKTKSNYIDLFGSPPKLDYWIMKSDGSGKRRITYFNYAANVSSNYDIQTVGDFVFNANTYELIATITPKNNLVEQIILIKFNYFMK